MPTESNNSIATQKKYEPHLSELATDAEQVERVRQIVLEADSLEEMLQDFNRYGVTKTMYFLQTFARESSAIKPLPILTGRTLKDSYRTPRNYRLLCECGHENGRHWYYKGNERGTESWDCRDCRCQRYRQARKDAIAKIREGA